MTIQEESTPTQYKILNLTVQILADETLTTASIRLFSDIEILSETGRTVTRVHPTPQATPQQLTAFLAWINANLSAFEANNPGLTRYVEEQE